MNTYPKRPGFKKSRIAMGLLIAAGSMGLTPTALYAAEETVVEEVVITGSNIRRKGDFDNPAPVQTVGQMEIGNAGAVQIQDVFKSITANSGSQLANRQNERQGVSQFSLRGLGVGSTLTLVNGRRAGLFAVPDDTGQLFTDVNQYPVNMIERVEVLTDGASATYGSEALAGVVNIITRDKFEGLEFTAEARDASNSSQQLSSAFGAAFDKGHFTIFANYYTQDGNFRGDFDWIEDNQTFSSSTGSPGTYSTATTDPVDGSITHGLGSSSTRVPDADCLEAEGTISSSRCRYNFIDQRRLIAEEERFQVFSKFNFDISESASFYSEISHSRNQVTDALGGAVLRTGPLGGNMFIPGSHPFNFWVDQGGDQPVYLDPTTNAADWANGTLVATDLAGQFRPLGTVLGDGPNADEIKTVFTNSRISSGFDIDLKNDWFLALNYTWANSDYTRREPRNYAVDLLQEIINDGRWNPFGTAVVSPDLVSPKDGATTAGNESLVLQEFSRSKTNTGSVMQQVAEAILSGEVSESIAVAVGAQYRRLDFEDFPDGLSGVLEGGRADETSPSEGSQDAIALFTELAWSVSDDLETQFALRYEDYDDKGGSTLDPKVAFKYNVNDDLSVRGSWGTSFQAPSIKQVSGSTGNATVTDPQQPGAGTFNATVVTGGSADLDPQSSTNYNLGLLYTADNGLDLSVDYWVYELEDLILPGASPQVIVDNCGAGTCPDVLRDATGQINAVLTSFDNRGTADVRGIDVKIAYAPDWNAEGDWIFDLSLTKFLEYDSSEFGDVKNSRNFGNPFGSTPDTKLNGGVTWMNGNHYVNLSARFVGDYTDDQTDETVDSQTTYDARYSYVFPGLIAGGDTTVTAGVVNITDEDPSLIGKRPGFDTEVHDPRGRQLYVSVKQTF